MAAHRALTQPPPAARPPTHVRATVFDSLTRTPLAGALVQLERESATGTASAVSDAAGRFELDLAPGRWVAGIVHPRFDSLGVTLPPRVLNVPASRSARLNVATPSALTLTRAYCGKVAPRDSAGVLVGYVRDARTLVAVPAATVAVEWTELIVVGRTIRREQPVLAARSDTSGWFVVCGIPAGEQLIAWAERGATSTGVVSLTSPPYGLARLDLRLDARAVDVLPPAGDSTVGTAAQPIRDRRPEPRRGPQRFIGIVRGATGRPVVGARARVPGHPYVLTDDRGAFRLDSLPAGSQMLEVRALGFAPLELQLDVSAEPVAPDTLMLTAVSMLLDTVRVTTRRVYDADVYGFEARRRLRSGTFITRDEIAREHPQRFSDLLQALPVMHFVTVGGGATVSFLMRGDMIATTCVPDIWLDGWRLVGSAATDVDFLAPPDKIDGVEVYSRPNQVPTEFLSTFGNCGAIVIWLRRGTTRIVKPKG